MSRLSLAVVLAATTMAPGLVRAEDAPALRVIVQCERAAEPGRVRCDAELRPRQGAVRWADVQITGTPDFVVPLRGRSGPHDAAAHEDDLWRWGLGLVARERGEGDVALRVRAVVCIDAVCAPELVTATAHLSVGR